MGYREFLTEDLLNLTDEYTALFLPTPPTMNQHIS